MLDGVAGVRPLHHGRPALVLQLTASLSPLEAGAGEAGHHGRDHAEEGDEEEDCQQDVVEQDEQARNTQHPANMDTVTLWSVKIFLEMF